MVFQIASEPSCRAKPTKRPVVLAADDHEDNLFLLSCSLDQFDCDVTGKTTGQAALEFAELHQPSLILLDLVMPDIPGLELMHLLRQRLGPDVPIIAFTGMPAAEHRELMTAAGFTDYLSKPYLLEDLEAMVLRWGILRLAAV